MKLSDAQRRLVCAQAWARRLWAMTSDEAIVEWLVVRLVRRFGERG